MAFQRRETAHDTHLKLPMLSGTGFERIGQGSTSGRSGNITAKDAATRTAVDRGAQHHRCPPQGRWYPLLMASRNRRRKCLQLSLLHIAEPNSR
jgi:hypothetical protein